MRFLAPVGGMVDAYGILTTPAHKGIPAGILAGMPWAADNEAYSRGWDADRFLPWLDTMQLYRATCLFVTVPDVVGDAVATLDAFRTYAPLLDRWPLAFVAQDGQEDLDLPDGFDVLFVGGSTEWKESTAAVSVIRRAQAIGKRIHIGRVNWKRRYQLFRVLKGSGDWTCDGTRTRFDGVTKTLSAWGAYENQPPLFTI